MGNNSSSLSQSIENNVKSCKPDWHDKLKELGSGGFGKVSLHLNKENDRKFALKICERRKMVKEEWNNFADMIESNQQDIDLKHPNIIEYYYKQSVNDSIYIYMEYAEYGSLASMYEHKFQFNDRFVGFYIRQLLSAVEYLHKDKIVHRDIKCQNILVTSPLIVKLSDFGLSKQLNKDEKCKGKLGTKPFCAPEVNSGECYDISVDIWSIGATVLQLVLGKVPDQLDYFQNDNSPLQYYSDKKLIEKNGKMFGFLEKCLVKNPQGRKTIKDLLADSYMCVRKLNNVEEEQILDHFYSRSERTIKTQYLKDLAEKQFAHSNIFQYIPILEMNEFKPTASNYYTSQENLIKRCTVLKFAIKETAMDGNCLFDAISKYIDDGKDHTYYRTITIDYLNNNETIDGTPLRHFLINQSLKDYITKMMKPGTWGDEITLRALSHVVQRSIKVYSSNGEQYDVVYGEQYGEDNMITLGHIVERHYVALIDEERIGKDRQKFISAVSNSESYKMERYLGSGAFGEVRSYTMKSTNQMFAVKLGSIKPEDLSQTKKLQNFCKFLNRKGFNHPHVIQFYHAELTGDEFKIFMEFAQYGSLTDLYKRNGGLIDHQICLYGKQILHALKYLHSEKIVHGDLKCENALLTSPTVVKLTDLSLSEIMSDKSREYSTKSGVSSSMSPHQNAGERAVFEDDIWSFGAMILELKLGQYPDQLNNLLSKTDSIAYYKKKDYVDLSPEVMEVLSLCLVKDEKLRAEISDLLRQTLFNLPNINENEFQTLKEDLKDCSRLVQEMIPLYKPWMQCRVKMIEIMEDTANYLNEVSKLKDRCQTGGSAVGIVGGVISGIGTALIPFTAGATLGLSIAGIVISAAGSVTGITGTVKNLVNTRKKKKEVEEIAGEDKSQAEKLVDSLKEIHSRILKCKIQNRLLYISYNISNSNVVLKDIDFNQSLASNVDNPGVAGVFSMGMFSVAKSGMNIFVDVFDGISDPILDAGAIVGATVTGGILNVLFIGVDIAQFCLSVKRLKNKTPHELSKLYNDQVDKLLTQLKEIQELCNALVPAIPLFKENLNEIEEQSIVDDANNQSSEKDVYEEKLESLKNRTNQSTE